MYFETKNKKWKHFKLIDLKNIKSLYLAIIKLILINLIG